MNVTGESKLSAVGSFNSTLVVAEAFFVVSIAAGTKLIAVSLMDLTEDIEDLLSASFRSFCFSASCFLK